MLGEEDPTEPRSFASQPKRIRALVLAAGSGMNFLVAVLAFALAYGTGVPDQNHVQVEVGEVLPATPADASGIRAGDIITKVNGEPVTSADQFRERSAEKQGQPLQLTLDRGGQEVNVITTPRTEFPEGQGPIGIRLQLRPLNLVSHGPIESLGYGLRRSVDVVGTTLMAPVMVIRGQIAPELMRPIGLPGMAQETARATTAVVASGWWYPILMLTAFFSAGLAVANMLPLPALDGGRLAFVIVEAIRGRRVPPEREGVIHLVGMGVLLSLMVIISFHDVISPPPGIDWGIR
jgi:regulator of sigma E protease